MHLADAAEVREQQQSAAKSRLSTHVLDLPTRRPPQLTGERLVRINWEVDLTELELTGILLYIYTIYYISVQFMYNSLVYVLYLSIIASFIERILFLIIIFL